MSDDFYIKLAIELAKKGRGKVSPNPLVGCVIIKNGKIIGEGYHKKFGGNHAEINAINSTKEQLDGSTLYVNLEPCSHYGKTPPCVDKIIEKKIKRVVIGTLDMNPLVSGRGVKKLRAEGIDVSVGILKNECLELNKFFFKYISKNLPYVTLKAAQTLDGKIADYTGNSKWISSIRSRKFVHSLRTNYDAVLVGSNTIRFDNPSLTVRLITGRNPKRIVLDTKLKLDLNKRIFTENYDNNLILITSFTSKKKSEKIKKLNSLGVKILFAKEDQDGMLSLKSVLRVLAENQITSLLVEGGSKVFSSFFNQNLYDDLMLFITPKILGQGLPLVSTPKNRTISNLTELNFFNVEKIGSDILAELRR